jgi:hypothetical protein
MSGVIPEKIQSKKRTMKKQNHKYIIDTPQIWAAREDDPPAKLEFESLDAAVKHLGEQGYVVRSTDEDSTYHKNLTEKEVNSRMAKVYNDFHGSIKELTGIDPDNNEKAGDFLKRAITTLNDSYSTKEQELQKKLEQKLSSDEATAEIRKQFETFKSTSKAELDKRDEEVNKLRQGIFQSRVDGILDSAIDQIKGSLKSDLNDWVIQSTLQNLKNQFKAGTIAKEVDGNIIFNDSNDQPLLDPKNANPRSAFDLMMEQIPEDLIDKGRQQGGAGSGEGSQGGKGDQGGAGEFDLSLPAEVKTRTDLVNYLKQTLEAKGIKHTDKEFTKYYNANQSKVKGL